jgi:glycosyltransferase involved in cell wall biosynthesis
LTPSVPERADMLAECEASVDAQSFRGWEHLILVDIEHQGCSVTMNALAREARAKWLFLLADDDMLLPGCLAAHLAASEGCDIVYSPPLVDGEPEPPFHGDPPGIPATALISRNLWNFLGGYDVERAQCEDLDFFDRALVAGAVFRRIPEQTWIYRLGHPGGNKSRGKVFGPR